MFFSVSELPADEVIIDAYIRDCQRVIEPDEDEPWPIDALRLLVYRDPDRAWRLLQRLVAVAPASLLSVIGTGPLEEFINRYGDRFVTAIESAAESERFVTALSNVWLSRGVYPPDIEGRLVRASKGTITLLNVEPTN